MASKKKTKSTTTKAGAGKRAGSSGKATRSARASSSAKSKKTAKKSSRVKKASGARVKKAAKAAQKRAAPARRAAKATTLKSGKLTTAKPLARKSARASAPPRPAASRKPAKALNAKDLEQFRLLLLQKRAELAGDVLTLQNEALNKNRQESAGDLSSMPIHMADLGSDNYEKEFTLGLIEGEREILREIDAALNRIKEGVYGICEATGKPISKARLKARPWARFCYEYVLAQENGRHIGA